MVALDGICFTYFTGHSLLEVLRFEGRTEELGVVREKGLLNLVWLQVGPNIHRHSVAQEDLPMWLVNNDAFNTLMTYPSVGRGRFLATLSSLIVTSGVLAMNPSGLCGQGERRAAAGFYTVVVAPVPLPR